MSDVTIKYKGATIATMDATGSKTLNTQGRYCEGDIDVEYVKPGGGGNQQVEADLISGELTGDYTNTLVTKVKSQACRDLKADTINFPNCLTVGDGGFRYMPNVTRIFIPKAVGSPSNNYCFANNPKLTAIALPAITRTLPLAFMSDVLLAAVDLGPDLTDFTNQTFSGCSILSTLILRRSTSIVGCGNVNCFNSTPFASGGSGGTIYIPKALYDHLGDGTALDYKAATNWATIEGYGTITWAQIEGSIYETQYADGTPIS